MPIDPNEFGKKQNPGTGRKTVYGPEFTGQDPAGHYYSGEIAPALAGERSKIEVAAEVVREFVKKYSSKAKEHFYGADPESVKQLAGPQASAVRAQRWGEKGAITGQTQVMDRQKALDAIDGLAEMPQEEAMSTVRALQHYVWKIHATARDELRQDVVDRMKKTGQLPLRRKEWGGRFVMDPKTGEPETIPGKYDLRSDEFLNALEAASKEFENDSTKVKGALNLLSASAGTLKRAAGKSGEADATFLQKVPKFGRPAEVEPKPPTTVLSPQMSRLAGPIAEPTKKSSSDPRKRVARAQGPIIHRKAQEALDRWVNDVIREAVADFEPSWLDEL